MSCQPVKAKLRLAALGLDCLAWLPLIGRQATAREALLQLWLQKLALYVEPISNLPSKIIENCEIMNGQLRSGIDHF